MEIGKLLPQNHGHKLHALGITNQGIHKIKVAKIFFKKKCSERILKELIFTSSEGDHYSINWWVLNPPVTLKKPFNSLRVLRVP